jgi:hypothetical protein
METTRFYPQESAKTQDAIVYDTKISTANLSISVMQDFVLPYVDGEIHWGQIGIGAEDPLTHLSCPVGPYRIAASLQAQNRPDRIVQRL